jgi:ArsR family transcriptional regulator
MEDKVKIFKALADSNRLRILKMLQTKSLCVCEIREVLQLANSTVSQHLSILKEAGFITENKEGRWVNYLINSNSQNPIINSILAMLVFWLKDEERLIEDAKQICDIDRNKICCK